MEKGLLGYECFAGYVVLSSSRKGGAFIIRIKKYMALEYEGTPFLRSAGNPSSKATMSLPSTYESSNDRMVCE
jgi:hypothetical protein